MKKGEIANSLLINYNCRYNHFVLGYNNMVYVVHLFRDFRVFKNLSYPFVIEGNLEMKGAKFMLRRPDIGVLMFYELRESLITDYYSRFKYYIYKTIPKTFNHMRQIEIRYINEDQCDVLTTIIYNNNIVLSENEFNSTLLFMNNLYKSIEASLRNFTIIKLSAPNIVIKSNIELVWNILRNMKLIHKYVNFLGFKVMYEGNVLKKGDIIELFNKKGKKEYKHLTKLLNVNLIK